MNRSEHERHHVIGGLTLSSAAKPRGYTAPDQRVGITKQVIAWSAGTPCYDCPTLAEGILPVVIDGKGFQEGLDLRIHLSMNAREPFK